MGVLALCLCACERVLLAGSRAGALAESVCVGGAAVEDVQMHCLCMRGMGQPCWLCVCEGDAVGAGEGELAVFVVSIGLGAAG